MPASEYERSQLGPRRPEEPDVRPTSPVLRRAGGEQSPLATQRKIAELSKASSAQSGAAFPKTYGNE